MRIEPDTAGSSAADDRYLGFTVEPQEPTSGIELDDSFDPASIEEKELARRALIPPSRVELAPSPAEPTPPSPIELVPTQVPHSLDDHAPADESPSPQLNADLGSPEASPDVSHDLSHAAELITAETQVAELTGPVEVESLPALETVDPADVDIDGAVVLLEHPGPWADDVVETATLPEAVRAQLRQLTDLGVHVALIRRPEGDQSRAVFCSVPDHGGLVVRTYLDDVSDLLEIDLVAVLRGAAASHAVPDGFTEAETQFLVTAHTVKQAHRAGAIVGAMTLIDPDDVWESSDLIGHPHEVSVIMLPGGHVSLGIRPGDANALIDAGWQGRVVLDRFVGRLQDDDVIRLAESTLRQRLMADVDAAVSPLEAVETPVASGERNDAETTVTRVVTTWQVFPSLSNDPALARMSPELSGQSHRRWRVVVDRLETVTGSSCEQHLSVVEVGDEDAPGGGVHMWDQAYGDDRPLGLPDPTVVAEVGQLPAGRALDLGCGTGRHALWLAEQGWQVTGVDFSRSGLWRLAEEAGARNVGVRAELADLRVWTPGGTRFDLILVSDVHVDDVFKRVSPWLSTTGRIVVIGPAKGFHTPDVVPIDYVQLAARATGARLRVLRAGEVERTDSEESRRDAVVVATRPN